MQTLIDQLFAMSNPYVCPHGRSIVIRLSLDLSRRCRVTQMQKRSHVDFPSWVVESLDREAARIGVTRQSIIKVWLVERLQAELLISR